MASTVDDDAASVFEKAKDIKPKHFDATLDTIPSQKGKTVAITGCTSGTGLILAEAMATKGARVFMLNRPSARAAEALAKVRAIAEQVEKGGAGHVLHVDCDLQNFASVRAAAAKVVALGVAVDVLVNNAGVMAIDDVATVDGYDVQMQTNHLSHFLLTSRLLPVLLKAPAPRVVQHSSGARKMVKGVSEAHLGKNGGRLGGDVVVGAFKGPRWERYAQSKLANIAFALSLADKVAALPADSPARKLLSLCAHPGFAVTQLQVTNAASDPTMNEWYAKYLPNAQAAQDGALGIMRAACDPSPDIVAGSLVGPEGMSGPAVVLDAADEQARVPPEDRQKLWALSLKAVGLTDFFTGVDYVAATDTAGASAAAGDGATAAGGGGASDAAL